MRNNEITVYQRTKTGKVSFKTFWTEDEYLCSEWGTTCQDKDKWQTTRKECQPMNVGKANATTGPEQAIVELQAKIVLNKKKGYVENLDEVQENVTGGADNDLIDLNNIPQKFVPCKPKKNAPAKFLDHDATYAQMKRNGHCLILVNADQQRVYSRTMEDITEYMLPVPEVASLMNQLQKGQMVLTEFCFTKENGKESPRTVGKLTRKKDAAAVMERYNLYSQRGVFEIVPFDMMFDGYEFIGDKPYLSRYTSMENNNIPNLPIIYHDWKSIEEDAKEKSWEGFVLRNDEVGSTIHYTMNGKADTGGSYKYKFLKEDDFIVLSAEKGKAGKHTGLYAQFFIAQYLQDGTLHKMGKCGPGKLKHDRLKEITDDIDSGELKFPFVIEIEYQSQQEDSGCLEFPQFQRIRDDKKPEECVTEFIPEID